MPSHPSWKGHLRISLVSVPLVAYTASTGGGGRGVTLNQLHAECKSRIQYKKVCPIHGEVPSDEIVSGYEFAKNQYAIIDPDEIDSLRPASDKSLNVDAFVSADAIDPIYFAGQTYYLLPDGSSAQKPYTLLRQSLAEEHVQAVGKVVISSRERLVCVRATGKLLMMEVLQYAHQLKQPAEFEESVHEVSGSPQEVKLTKSLLQAMKSKTLDIAEYHDDSALQLRELIDAKIEGREVAVPAATAPAPTVINLMEALKASVEQVKVPKRPTARQSAMEMTPRARARRTVPPSRRKKSG